MYTVTGKAVACLMSCMFGMGLDDAAHLCTEESGNSTPPETQNALAPEVH